ncbi:MAG: hypothetical protein DIU74_010885 [Pseudomonadota bacterium]|nr:MAG: hypothetical protein DIU74_04445 [Pseudomonadota bacterium]
MSMTEWMEMASYVVTVFGLPFAIYAFIREQRKERENEDEEGWQRLSDAYNDFLKLVLANPDLKLLTGERAFDLSEEQRERQRVIFEMLISLFERAYILLYTEPLTGRRKRRWHSWEDYMRHWCAREDFRELLPEMLSGEDEEFAAYIERLAREEATRRPR